MIFVPLVGIRSKYRRSSSVKERISVLFLASNSLELATVNLLKYNGEDPLYRIRPLGIRTLSVLGADKDNQLSQLLSLRLLPAKTSVITLGTITV